MSARTWRPAIATAVIGATLGIATAVRVLACNACLEDKVAATYDWQVVTAAARSGHTMVYTALHGAVRPGDTAIAAEITRRLSLVPGIDRRSIRIALAPAAVSFATPYPPSRVAAVVAAANTALRARGLKLEVVRVGAPNGAVLTTSRERDDALPRHAASP